MNRALEILPPLWEVNHQIPIIDKNKRYKYHVSRCPDSLKNELSKKIMRYTCTKCSFTVKSDSDIISLGVGF